MPHIKILLNNLNSMEPISNQFGDHLGSMLSKHTKNNNYTFLKPGQIAKKVWAVLSGFIVSLGQDINGNETVIDIYSEGAIVTDLLSYFKNEPVKYKFVAIGKVEILELKKEHNYINLQRHPETFKLDNAVTLLALKMKTVKEELSKLPLEAKMIRFFKDYKVSDLPHKYCASFLNITLDEYLELKAELLKSGKIELATASSKTGSRTYYEQKVYEVKLYLLDNYTRPDMCNIVKIASLFNTGKKILTEHFKKVMGITVYQLILKLRMEKALILLSNDKIPVKEVYSMVGYNDVYYFSKMFKNHHGFYAKEAITRSIP